MENIGTSSEDQIGSVSHHHSTAPSPPFLNNKFVSVVCMVSHAVPINTEITNVIFHLFIWQTNPTYNCVKLLRVKSFSQQLDTNYIRPSTFNSLVQNPNHKASPVQLGSVGTNLEWVVKSTQLEPLLLHRKKENSPSFPLPILFRVGKRPVLIVVIEQEALLTNTYCNIVGN